MLIEVENLSKDYGEIQALKSINLSLGDEEIVGVLGPNGAGKSTLLKVLTGQIDRDKGEISVLGLDPAKKGVKVRDKIGILPEREDPPSFLTGNEYLDFVSNIRNEPIDKEKWVEKFNLKGKMDKYTYNLSKGERQKLMIIQAVFHKPKLLFIDEPLINLDPMIQERSKTVFKDLKNSGGSILLCTHVTSLAEEICDKVVFLEDGEIIDNIKDPENLTDKFLEET